MSGHWVVSTASEPATAHDTEAAANRAADGVKGAVVWYCAGVEEAGMVPETRVMAPVAATGVVERVLGHLGVVLPTNREVA